MLPHLFYPWWHKNEHRRMITYIYVALHYMGTKYHKLAPTAYTTDYQGAWKTNFWACKLVSNHDVKVRQSFSLAPQNPIFYSISLRNSSKHFLMKLQLPVAWASGRQNLLSQLQTKFKGYQTRFLRMLTITTIWIYGGWSSQLYTQPEQLWNYITTIISCFV